MPVSSKKKRGQQRKAAKSHANNSSRDAATTRQTTAITQVPELDERKCLRDIARGRDVPTRALLLKDNNGNYICGNEIAVTALPHVLNFLKRCEHETFDQVMTSVRGDLKSPDIWIKVLYRAYEVEPSCSLQIAENIGPLVSCMTSDMDRLFFKSNTYWKEGILEFVELIYDMIRDNVGKLEYEGKNEIVEALLQHDGLLTAIIQWGYWDIEHRPDIVGELVINECERPIVAMGRDLSMCLVGDAIQWNKGNNLSNEGMNRAQAIGMTPIVAKAYDPNCMISYTAGFVKQGKPGSEEWAGIGGAILRVLISEADCVDKGVISEMVDLGLNYSDDYDRASDVAIVSYSMILEDADMSKKLPNDSRVAFAIRAGLIEMCLNFIERFIEHESLVEPLVSQSITHIFRKIHAISLHQKTAKAITSKRAVIEDRLVKLQTDTNITNYSICKKLLDMAWSILDINGSYCCRCNESLLRRTDVKLCNGCGCMAYCSKVCQRDDWLNGHSITCNNTPINENLGFFQGRAWLETVPECPRIVAKLEDLETNLNMIQLKLFLDNSKTILNQTSSLELDLPLFDCVVVFDLRVCPHTITIKKYTKYYGSTFIEELNGFECSRSKENIACIYNSCFYNGESCKVKGEVNKLVTQRLFPHAWLMK